MLVLCCELSFLAGYDSNVFNVFSVLSFGKFMLFVLQVFVLLSKKCVLLLALLSFWFFS